MLLLTILLNIPNIYPIKIKHKNNALFPLVDLDFIDFIMFTGHETPNKITINISNNNAILHLLLLF